MEKQIVEISHDGFILSLYKGFLEIQNKKEATKQLVPTDNILSLVLSANDILITKNIVSALIEQGTILIFCDKNYLPTAVTLPYIGHWLTAPRIRTQITCKKTLQKQLWKSIIQYKILNQASVLKHFYPNNKNTERLVYLARNTLSNDVSNNEGMAAGIYFKSLFGENFIRNRTGHDVNILLNYAYIVLRAVVARAVAGNGILPYIGLHHCQEANTMPLIDDIIEPFRAFADKTVVEIIQNNFFNIETGLTPDIKRRLTSLITMPVQTEKGKVSLNTAVYDFVNSLVKSYELKKVALQFPRLTV